MEHPPRSAEHQVGGQESPLSDQLRRRLGAHYTPPELAGRLVELGWTALGREPRVVCDPSCGAGSILLAAAERFLRAGSEPTEIVGNRLLGVEVDPSAAAGAREALRAWAARRGAGVEVEPNVVVADSLMEGPATWIGRLQGSVDLVCGNPPFLGQLSRATAFEGAARSGLRARWPHVGPYTDASALHLLVALDLVGADGAVVLLQPQSVLSSRDAAEVRAEVMRRGRFLALWASGEQLFEGADVEVCAPVIRIGEGSGAPSGGEVSLLWEDRPATSTRLEPGSTNWGPMLAAMTGVPEASPQVDTQPLAELAELTAGFRDEFYALTSAASDGGTGGARLVSVGMIDPGVLRWGSGSWRMAGRRMTMPVVDTSALTEQAPRVASWVHRRLVPKVLVATQTKVIEAVEDPAGDTVPLTPVISVEPRAGGPEVLALLAASLSAPCVSAQLAARVAGTGLSSGTLRPTARSLASLPSPRGPVARSDLVAAWRRLTSSPGEPEDWRAFARAADACFGVVDEALVQWWWERHPARTRPGGSQRA